MNIYINKQDTKINENETCYIIAKGGIYLKKKLDLIESLTPVDKISFLEDISTFAKINIPKISKENFGQIIGFFKEVYNLYHSESMVLLFYNKEKQDYKIYVPSQIVSGAGIKYETDKTFKNYVLVGSIHSHANFSAFHSPIDKNDETNFDGLHITVGHLMDDPYFDICGSIAINKMRVAIEPKDYIEDIELKVKPSTNFYYIFENYQQFMPKKGAKEEYRYVLNEVNDETFEFDQNWLSQVQKEVIQVKEVAVVNNRSTLNNQQLTFNNLWNFGKNNSECEEDKINKFKCSSCRYRNVKLRRDEFLENKKKKKLDNNYEDDIFNDFGNINWWGEDIY